MKFLQTILLILATIAMATAATLNIKGESLEILPQLQVIESPEEIFFNCGDAKFISQELICDGREDCSSGYDEENCEIKNIESEVGDN